MKALLLISMLTLSLHLAGQSDSTHKPKPCTTCTGSKPEKQTGNKIGKRVGQSLKNQGRIAVSTATTMVEGTLQNKLQTAIIEILH